MLTWDISGISNSVSPAKFYYTLTYNTAIGYLTPGDTVHSYYTITPFAGDVDTTNNTQTIIDTVRSGYDPNEMFVSPAGCISPGAGTTQLQYTIHFENTGNDTAFNIYVMDTLSDNVDPSTMNIVMGSAEMYTTKLHSNTGQNILKFDFPGINLLDSSHHGQCDGAVIFSINTRLGLPSGTTIFNHAGIFFDINPVVLTNTVENITDCPLSVSNTATDSKSLVEIYPNPSADELAIKIDRDAYGSCSVSNSIGQVYLQQQLNSTQTKVNVKMLPAGLYYITLTGEKGTVVRKFVKQ